MEICIMHIMEMTYLTFLISSNFLQRNTKDCIMKMYILDKIKSISFIKAVKVV